MTWPGSMPFVSSISVLSATFGLSPPPSSFSPSWSFFRFHSNSLSLAPSLPPIPVVFKNFINGATNATIGFAEATGRLNNNRWRHREEDDGRSNRQNWSSEESDEEAEGGEGRDRN